MKRLHALLAAAFAGSLLLSGNVFATSYALEGALRYDAGHDDNLRLSSDPDSSANQTTSGRLNFSTASERTEAAVDAQLWQRRYNSSGLDSDDQTVRANLSHMLERSQFSLGLSGVRDSTLTSELLDSGRVDAAERHEAYAIAPGWSYQLGELDLLSLDGSYMTSHYSGDSYTDYVYWQSKLLWTHMLTERLRSFVSLDYSDYQTQELSYPYDQTYASGSTETGLQLGGDYQLSENLSVSLFAGRSRSRNDVQIDDPQQYCATTAGTPLQALFPLCALEDTETSQATYRGTITLDQERNQFQLTVAQDTQPSSNGYVQQTEQLDLSWHHRLWESGNFGIVTTLGHTDASDARVSRSNEPARDYLFTTVSYTHALSETWSIDVNYRYRSQQYDGADRVESHAAFAGITWTPRSRHWSR